MCVCVRVSTEALGDFDEPQRSSLTMFGVLINAVRIYQDRWGYGIYSGPIGSAVFIITVKWVSPLSPSAPSSSSSSNIAVSLTEMKNQPTVDADLGSLSWPWLLFQLQKMKQLRAVYPEKSVYTQQVGPGCCFGALALMLRFYFEVTTWEKKPVPDAQAPSTPRSLINVDCVCVSVSPPFRSGTTPTCTASTTCRWPCPSCCCCPRGTAMRERDGTPPSSAASRSAVVYVASFRLRGLMCGMCVLRLV